MYASFSKPFSSPTKVIVYKSNGELFLLKQNLRFGLVLGWLAVLKISAILLKYLFLKVIFSCFLSHNKYEIRVSVYTYDSSVRTKI